MVFGELRAEIVPEPSSGRGAGFRQPSPEQQYAANTAYIAYAAKSELCAAKFRDLSSQEQDSAPKMTSKSEPGGTPETTKNRYCLKI